MPLTPEQEAALRMTPQGAMDLIGGPGGVGTLTPNQAMDAVSAQGGPGNLTPDQALQLFSTPQPAPVAQQTQGSNDDFLQQVEEQMRSLGMDVGDGEPEEVFDPGPSFGSTVRNFGINTYLNNLMALPSSSGDAVAYLSAAAKTGFDNMAGIDSSFGQNLQQQQQQFPASVLRSIPSPTMQDLASGLRSIPSLVPGGETPSQAFGRHATDIAAQEQDAREAHPFAAGLGEVGGDVATILSGRAGAANRINKAENALARRPQLFFGSAASQMPTNTRWILDNFIKSQPMRNLAKGIGRSVETGFEAAVLDLLHGDDPLETAFFAAGGQASGSVLLQGGKSLFTGKHPFLTGISLAALGGIALWQGAKSLAPGGRDRILESIESSYDKVTWGIALGVAAGLTGGGRLRGREIADRFPIFSDALPAIPRVAMVSFMEDMFDSDQATQSTVETVMDRLAGDPNYFGTTVGKRLERAFNSPDVSVTAEIERLMDNRDFRAKLDELETGGTQ